MAEEQKVHVATDPQHTFSIWWDPDQPDRIRVATVDPQFVDENGERPGLQIVFSANPKSADFNPANFNRCARALQESAKVTGLPAPSLVPLQPRHLRYRSEIIAAASAGEVAQPSAVVAAEAGDSATPADPADFGWSMCPDCGCVVVSVADHTCHLKNA